MLGKERLLLALRVDLLGFTLVQAFDARLARLLLDLPLQGAIVVVFYVVISAAVQVLRDFGPPVPVRLVHLEYLAILFLCPLVLFDVRIEMIVPPTTEQKSI